MRPRTHWGSLVRDDQCHRDHRTQRGFNSCDGVSQRDQARRNRDSFDAVVRIDTPGEADYYRNGGILQFVLRSLLA